MKNVECENYKVKRDQNCHHLDRGSSKKKKLQKHERHHIERNIKRKEVSLIKRKEIVDGI